MKLINFFLLFFFLSFSASAQFRLSGRLVHADDSLGVEYAVVQAFAKDSVLLGAVTSNSHGFFEIETPKASSRIRIRSLVCQDTCVRTDSFSENGLLHLGKLVLRPAHYQLAEVSVSGKVDQLVHKLGKSTFDVTALPIMIL